LRGAPLLFSAKFAENTHSFLRTVKKFFIPKPNNNLHPVSFTFRLKLFFNEQYSTSHTESPDGRHVGFDDGMVYIPSSYPRAGVSNVWECADGANLIPFPDVRYLLGDGIFPFSCADSLGISFESLEYGP